MAEETNVQLASDGSGKKIKNFLLRGVVQSDGTSADVYVQCTNVLDGDGRLVDFDEMSKILNRIYREMKLMRQIVGEITQHGGALGFGDGYDPRVNDEE